MDAEEYEVEDILDSPFKRKTCYGRIHKHYLVRWKENSDLT